MNKTKQNQEKKQRQTHLKHNNKKNTVIMQPVAKQWG
jgi:hypothetical protein